MKLKLCLLSSWSAEMHAFRVQGVFSTRHLAQFANSVQHSLELTFTVSYEHDVICIYESDIEVSPASISRPRSWMSFTMALIKAETIVGDKLFPCATPDRQLNNFVVLSLIFIVSMFFIHAFDRLIYLTFNAEFLQFIKQHIT